MSAQLAGAVEANIEGQKAAKAVLAEIGRGTALPDALEYALRAVDASWGRPGMTGACRIVQKALEAALP